MSLYWNCCGGPPLASDENDGQSLSPITVAGLVGATLLYGWATMRGEHLRPTFVAAVLQNDIDQNVYHDPAYIARVLHTFTAQSQVAAAHGAALAVWPETAFPGYLLNDRDNRAYVQAQAVQDTSGTGDRHRGIRLAAARTDQQSVLHAADRPCHGALPEASPGPVR